MSLLTLADRLAAGDLVLVADAARRAALPGPGRLPIPPDALRSQALEAAVRLDARGLHAEAQAIFDEVRRRDGGAPGALADGPFGAWLGAIGAGLDETEPTSIAA